MASITFEGLDPTDPSGQSRSASKVSMPDEVMLLAVEAICVAYKYQPTVLNDGGETIANPVGPGTFAIQKIVDFCTDHVQSYGPKKAAKIASDAEVEKLRPLKETIKIEQVE